MLFKKLMSIDEDNIGESDNLSYLNIRANKLEKIEEIKKLKNFVGLKTIVLSSNPIKDKFGKEYVYELISEMRTLERINKQNIDIEMRRKLYEYEKNKYIEDKKKEEELEEVEQKEE